ncbi:uncharacterized protein THITE_2113943 [Thermothielavioides terrestris NRRL 8126]|uniref:BTB domain-containing protein n=1 Tax=Thermothielavioides terrestris (strain ATCC 38088 / NRRL 8126) TaxID=578455 RepID=G2R4R3_THETT|nr:uncharacterized protein THITE_2113943 [Thermothielavioides terrestris NRRL 8126]AEO66103.1 hypothetical protein THITE_2113943 [Thermothielavioides terrestris NRRL 8126]
MRWSTEKAVVGSLEGCETVKVLVGDEQREFTLRRELLRDSCAFFKTHLDSIPSPSSASCPGNGGGTDSEAREGKQQQQQQGQEAEKAEEAEGDEDEDTVLWLPNEAADMFEIFVLWLYQRKRFASFLDHAIHAMTPDECRSLRTNLVRLHLFAAVIDLPALQDAAMDALQDLYLRFDWDMSPRFLAFLYGDCDAQHAVRLRKWAVAMLAWTLHGGADKAPALAGPVDRLFAAYPDLRADYQMHLHKMAQSRADVRIKNPQLRLPANRLRSGERYFGFRQCTFHSHRATVGEGTCPHALALGLSHPAAHRWDGEEVESDGSDADHAIIISPVGDLSERSYLDLS